MSIDHYENFPVASILCPPHLRSAISAIYAFARTADDIADEGSANADERLEELAAFRHDLQKALCHQSTSVRWPQVFGPLQKTLREHQLPPALLFDLLSAFEQDVVKQRYADRAELLDYCRRSANPVGRLLLHLYGIDDLSNIHHRNALRQSDAICTALQLTNFWQDLRIDSSRGRIYLPVTDCARHGVTESWLMRQCDTPPLHALMADMVLWTRALMLSGAPLVHALPGRAGWELRLVVQGGLRILEKIEKLHYATMLTRPAVGKGDVPVLLWRALCMRATLVTPVTGATT